MSMLFLPSIARSFVVHSVLELEVSAHARKPEVPIAVLPGAVRLLEFVVACDDAEECLEEPKWECEVFAVDETSFRDREALSYRCYRIARSPVVTFRTSAWLCGSRGKKI